MITRRQYMANHALRSAYFQQFVNDAMRGRVEQHFTIERLVEFADRPLGFNDPKMLLEWESLLPAARLYVTYTQLFLTGQEWGYGFGLRVLKSAGQDLVDSYWTKAVA
jgi:hypothetical protein